MLTLEDIDGNIKNCKTNIEDHQAIIDDIIIRLEQLQAMRCELLVARIGLVEGDKLLMTKEAMSNIDTMYFSAGDICLFKRHKNKTVAFVEKYRNGQVYASCAVALSDVLDMKIAYGESVEVD